MSFIKKRKTQLNIKSASDNLKDGLAPLNVDSLLIHAPREVDCLTRRWHRKDMITVMGHSGSGKTSFNLYCFKSILKNNPKGIAIFVATEMQLNQILNKWVKLTRDCPEISDRLYIHTAHDEEGNANDMSMVGIINTIREYKSVLNTEILSVVVDHLHNLDMKEGTLDDATKMFNDACSSMCFTGFLNCQTSKGRGGHGDIPLCKNSPFGTSKPTQDSVYMISISQPLKRIQDQVDMPVTAFSYAKIRFKEKDDVLKETINYLLMFDYETEDYRGLTPDEKILFNTYYESVIEMRNEEEKNKAHIYDTSYTIPSKSGKPVRVNNVSNHIKNSW